MTRTTSARYLRPGDVLTGSGATIHRVVTDGLFMRRPDDTPSRTLWPKGKVEVMVTYPGYPAQVAYWNARTTMQVSSSPA